MYAGDCRKILPALPEKSVHCVVTSPPYYGLRDYGHGDQIGLESTPEAYVAELVGVFREVHRVLRDDGTLWLNLGDSYAATPAGNKTPSGVSQNTPKRLKAGLQAYNTQKKGFGDAKHKDLLGIPWMVAFALRADGWYLRQDIIWSKPNTLPEPVRDRCTKSHEYIFLLAKQPRYYYYADAISEPMASSSVERYDYAFGGSKSRELIEANKFGVGQRTRIDGFRRMPERRNKRSVWVVSPVSFREAHFATFPPRLIEPCILAGCPEGGVVLDPFAGSGTTGVEADRLGRRAVLIELNQGYARMGIERAHIPESLTRD
jgi:DNA modification methylase